MEDNHSNDLQQSLINMNKVYKNYYKKILIYIKKPKIVKVDFYCSDNNLTDKDMIKIFRG